jgi:hypothetical protein
MGGEHVNGGDPRRIGHPCLIGVRLGSIAGIALALQQKDEIRAVRAVQLAAQQQLSVE